MIQLKYPKFWNNRSFLAWLLFPVGWLYLLLGKIRKLLTKPMKLPGYVICVGNMTVGGTGKTQVVLWLARHFNKQGISFAIVSKGYGGDYKEPIIVKNDMLPQLVGDEALELCEVGITIVARKVVDSISILSEIKPEVIIVDDGMQNSSFLKDHLLLVIDGQRGFGNGFPIPAGPMRQVKNFDNVSSIIFIGHDDTDLKQDISNNIPMFQASIIPASILDQGINYYAFAAIGNPDKFFNTLKASGINLVATKDFPDHYIYSSEDIRSIIQNSDALDAIPVTSRKDYVKIRNKKYSDRILSFDVVIEVENQDKFIKIIYDKVA